MDVAAFVVSAIAVILSGVAVLYSRAQAQTAERVRVVEQDPIFRGSWVQLFTLGTLNEATLNYDSPVKGPVVFWVRNTGKGVAHDLRWGTRRGSTGPFGPEDAGRDWTCQWTVAEVDNAKWFDLTWVSVDGKPQRQHIRIPTIPDVVPRIDAYGNLFRP